MALWVIEEGLNCDNCALLRNYTVASDHFPNTFGTRDLEAGSVFAFPWKIQLGKLLDVLVFGGTGQFTRDLAEKCLI